jgi:hypothetical protein
MRHLIKKILREQITPNLPIKLSGSYRVPDTAPMKGDALHSFDRRLMDNFGGYMLRGGPIPSRWSSFVKLDQGKGINQVLEDLVKSGVKPDVTEINIKVNDDYSVDWSATIDESADGKAYYGVASRGSAGGGADARALGQIPKLKSKNSKYCNWTEVLDLNITKPIKIRQFFLKYTKCNEGEESGPIQFKPKEEIEKEYEDWESGVYKIEGDEQWTYKLNNDKDWEGKLLDGEFMVLRDHLSSEDYDEALMNLKKAELVTTETYQRLIKNILRSEVRTIMEKEMKEKWSMKYKKSINCNNPKGFSQRAHCQGRKKRKNN